ncbi:MAG TPA: hypothetical protein VGX23_06720 [Actinocrinis sp.]|nr:hypothetical protein [Actinocrinis sp.]
MQDPEEPGAGDAAAAAPGRRRGSRALRWGVLVLVVLLGCWAGGWLRAWSGAGLTTAQADQVTLRPALDGFALGQSNGCDDLGRSQAVLQIPLHNYSPGPVQVDSIAVDPPGQAPEAAQKTRVTIAAGSSAVVEVLIPIQLCTEQKAQWCPSTDVELDATASVIPKSGRVHQIRLPIAEWLPTTSLQLYEDAPFSGWGISANC